MIISDRVDKERELFEDLLVKSTDTVKRDSEKNPGYYMGRSSSEFETDVYTAMCDVAKGTDFYKSIQLISGYKFPDIVAKKIYGVEVKTTKQDQWKSTGNSVLETTRITDVERIYLFFGKLSAPLGFKWRQYEECLYDIAVTHSPRYLIDMNLVSGSSIFDKIGTSYDDLRLSGNPIKEIINYYRGIAKKGEEPWWMDAGDEVETIIKPTVNMWNTLDVSEQDAIRIAAMTLFPEIFGKSSRTKYQRLALWLAARHGIIASSLRDQFTAGGKVDLTVKNKEYTQLPRIFQKLYDNVEEVVESVNRLSPDDAKYYWDLEEEPGYADKVNHWAKRIIAYAKPILGDSQEFIGHLLGTTFGEIKSPSCVKEEMELFGLDY